MIEKTPRLQGVPREIVQAIFDLLRRMYPNHGGISGLLPDLLGERLVALALDQDDELLDVCLGAQASSETARRSLTLLARLAQRFPEDGRGWLKHYDVTCPNAVRGPTGGYRGWRPDARSPDGCPHHILERAISSRLPDGHR